MPSARVKKGVKTNQVIDYGLKSTFRAYGAEAMTPLEKRKPIIPYLNKIKHKESLAPPLMKRTIKQGKFSRIFMKNTRTNNQSPPKNEDILPPKKQKERRGSDIPIKQPTLDEYMKKYENSPPVETLESPKYSMSVPPSNKTVQMMNLEIAQKGQKGPLMLNQ